MQSSNQLLVTISNILQEIIKETDQMCLESTTLFHASKAPSISILNYITRISKYTHCSDECFVMALIYLDRIQEKHTDLVLNSYCIHRFIIVSIMVAIKFQDDDYYKNEYYAKVGGIPLKEVNQLELEFLELINYDLYISTNHYNLYLRKLFEYIEVEI